MFWFLLMIFWRLVAINNKYTGYFFPFLPSILVFFTIFLCIEISWTSNAIMVSQHQYIEDLLYDVNMLDKKGVTTVMSSSVSLCLNDMSLMPLSMSHYYKASIFFVYQTEHIFLSTCFLIYGCPYWLSLQNYKMYSMLSLPHGWLWL